MGIFSVNGYGIDNRNVYIKDLKEMYPNYSDDQLLDKAIVIAKVIGAASKIIWDGMGVHFSGEITHECKGFGGIDFNGSVIYMPNHDGEAIINVVPDASEDIIVSSQDIFSNYLNDDRLKGKVFRFNDVNVGNADMCLGYRYGDPNDIIVYNAQTVYVSEDGHYKTGPLYITPETGNVVCYNVHEYPLTTFELCNATISVSNGNSFTTFFQCSRSNTHVHNITLKKRTSISSFSWGIFKFVSCCGIDVGYVNGENPFLRDGGSYFLSLLSVSIAHLHDICVGDSLSWGCVGNRFLTNTVVERCHLNRWDCHFAQYGQLVLRDSVFTSVNFGIGYGQIAIENCSILAHNNHDDFIGARNDCYGTFNGNIVVKNCNFFSNDRDPSDLVVLRDSVSYANPGNSKIANTVNGERSLENCIFPSGIKNIFLAGTSVANDQTMYENLTLSVSNSNINTSDSVFEVVDSGQAIKKVRLSECYFDNTCNVTKVLSDCIIDVFACLFGSNQAKIVSNEKTVFVFGSELLNMQSQNMSASLIMIGNVVNGTQDVSKFTKYNLSGNISSDMTSVNVHSN